MAAHLGPQLLTRFGAGVVIATGLILAAGGELLLSFAPADAGYVLDLLPGFVVLGFGVGLVFVGASVTAMSEIDHSQAGLASGLMTTAHEIGAAFGVAILSSVALSGVLGGSGAVLRRRLRRWSARGSDPRRRPRTPRRRDHPGLPTQRRSTRRHALRAPARHLTSRGPRPCASESDEAGSRRIEEESSAAAIWPQAAR